MRAPAEAGGLIGPHLQAFFAEHLLAHKRASPQTIACYRDTCRLLLRFMRERTGAEPAALPLAALDADAVLALSMAVEIWLARKFTWAGQGPGCWYGMAGFRLWLWVGA